MPGLRTFIEIMMALGGSEEIHEHKHKGVEPRRASCFDAHNQGLHVGDATDFNFAKDLEFDNELIIRKCLGIYHFHTSDKLKRPQFLELFRRLGIEDATIMKTFTKALNKQGGVCLRAAREKVEH